MTDCTPCGQTHFLPWCTLLALRLTRGVWVLFTGLLYLNDSMTSLTAVVVNQSAFADTFGEGGVTTFTNSPFI